MLNAKEQKQNAKEFIDYWNNKGYEKGECQPFWMSLLRNVFGIKEPEKFIEFEDQVHLDHTSFIDAYIPSTKVLIEQKSIGKNLQQPIKQSNGTLRTPFEQAKNYTVELPYSRRPRWIITCNFEEFNVYDMEDPQGEPQVIYLKDLAKEFYRLSFLVDSNALTIRKEMEVSIEAGKYVANIYDALLEQYDDKESVETLKSLNVLCVRLVFLLYAEDSGLFEKKGMFLEFLKSFDSNHLRTALIDLFKILDTPNKNRDKYLEDYLASFPYVNGGLFADDTIEIPKFSEKIKNVLIDASESFDWTPISPTIFGAVFESTLNQETRAKGGMHYTSIENIHKVINPLFLNDLYEEFYKIAKIRQPKILHEKIISFQNKISKLKFMDPACGSGNFLTESYLSLRRLENKALKLYFSSRTKSDEALEDQMSFLLGDENTNVEHPIKVSINQFYGIEINDFAVTVAKTALWISEYQMFLETKDIISGMKDDYLPLSTNNNIVEGNALRIDWNDIVSNQNLNYIMGNPPFIGARKKTKEQKKDLEIIFGKKTKKIGDLDYVVGWYKKADEYIKDTNITCAFVSTNSITQGEQPYILWSNLSDKFTINFAYRTFRWDSEATIKAKVHCVIIGFSRVDNKDKIIFIKDTQIKTQNINGYLLPGENILLASNKKPLWNTPPLVFGSMANDGGNFILNSDEKKKLIKAYPESESFIKPFLGSDEYLNGKERYCLWLKGVSPSLINSIPPVRKRVENVKNIRLASPRKATNKLANYPTLFGEDRQPDSNYLMIPRVSSQNREYIPIGFLTSDIIASDACLIMPNANVFEFAIMTSSVHNIWMRGVAGRLKSDFRYSASIVYNNFPWPEVDINLKNEIVTAGQNILDVRSKYKNETLANLYSTSMPPELRKAHEYNDKLIMKAYGFKKDLSEMDIVISLLKQYKSRLNS